MLMTGEQRKVGEVEDKCFKWKKSFVCKSIQLKTLHFDQPLHAATVSPCCLTPQTEDILGLWQVIVILWAVKNSPEFVVDKIMNDKLLFAYCYHRF